MRKLTIILLFCTAAHAHSTLPMAHLKTAFTHCKSMLRKGQPVARQMTQPLGNACKFLCAHKKHVALFGASFAATFTAWASIAYIANPANRPNIFQRIRRRWQQFWNAADNPPPAPKRRRRAPAQPAHPTVVPVQAGPAAVTEVAPPEINGERFLDTEDPLRGAPEDARHKTQLANAPFGKGNIANARIKLLQDAASGNPLYEEYKPEDSRDERTQKVLFNASLGEFKDMHKQIPNINLNACDKDGNSILHCLVRHNRGFQFAEEVIRANPALVNKQNRITGRTPLHQAITYNKLDAALQLVTRHGTNPNLQDAYENTALHHLSRLAAKLTGKALQQCTALRGLLIASDAKIEIQNKAQEDGFLAKDQKEILRKKQLLKSVPNVEPKLQRELQHIFADACGPVEPYNAEPTETDKRVYRLIHNQNVFLNQQNNYGQTPLRRAILMQNTRLALLLLRNGADPNLRDINGNTALHCLARIAYGAPRPDYVRFLNLRNQLVEHGADLGIQNHTGDIPITVNQQFFQLPMMTTEGEVSA